MLEAGTKAPDFELPDQNGEMHKLSDYAGKKDRKSTRLNSSHPPESRMPSSA